VVFPTFRAKQRGSPGAGILHSGIIWGIDPIATAGGVEASYLPYPLIVIQDILTLARRFTMQAKTRANPWWAALTVWGVVNAVNVLQSAGFLSRVVTGNREINHLLGFGIVALAVPAVIAIIAFIYASSGWRQWIGPVVFLAFIVLMVAVEYICQVEFRSPMRYDILVPYLVLFFGSILLMGLPMFRMNRKLWLVTVITTVLLLGSMGFAIYTGVG